jgi:hypothetical protein
VLADAVGPCSLGDQIDHLHLGVRELIDRSARVERLGPPLT